MCTLIIYRNASHTWPCIIATNRDELINRTFITPGVHWKSSPNIFAGKDKKAGGSWLGINNNGMCVAILNRKSNGKKIISKISRGEIVLKALAKNNSKESLHELSKLKIHNFEPFNLIIADKNQAYWVKHEDYAQLIVKKIPFGLSIIDAHDLNDLTSLRIKYNLKKIKKAKTPDPDNNNWKEWIDLLCSEEYYGEQNNSAINLNLSSERFGTVCSSIIAIPKNISVKKNILPIWLYSDVRPAPNKFYKLDINQIYKNK